MTNFDPRLTPARPDLAAMHLRGKVKAARFAAGISMRVADELAPLRRAPAHDAPLDTELLHGEDFSVYEMTDEGWAWGQAKRDGYVGWLPANALAKGEAPPTHRVAALRTFVFPKPDIKAPPLAARLFGSLLAISREEENFAVLADGGFVPKQHLVPQDHRESDPVAAAQKFMNVPYLWGGRSSLGLDCSGLVQLALQSAGIEAPRDSDMQQSLGARIAHADLAALRRGDLLFWKGHVGFIAGEGRLLHANAFHMAVAEERLDEAVARIAGAGLEVLEARRV